MARNLTIATLITRCKQRCDREGDGHITDGEWQSLISEVNGELQLLVAETGSRYFETEATITADGSTSYALATVASDMLSHLGIERVVDASGKRSPLREVMIQERASRLGRTGEATEYAIVAQTIELYPAPASGSYKLVYIPQPPDISASATNTNVDVVTPDGEAFLLWGVASIALHKSESDQRRAMMERDRASERLRDWAQRRAFVTPRRQITTSWADYREPGGWWDRG